MTTIFPRSASNDSLVFFAIFLYLNGCPVSKVLITKVNIKRSRHKRSYTFCVSSLAIDYILLTVKCDSSFLFIL